jgi:hypothetical protein
MTFVAHFHSLSSWPTIKLQMASTPAFPIASGKKKAVQVFECPQETWKSKKSGSTARTARAQNQRDEVSIDEEIKKEFNDALQSVKEFGELAPCDLSLRALHLAILIGLLVSVCVVV